MSILRGVYLDSFTSRKSIGPRIHKPPNVAKDRPFATLFGAQGLHGVLLGRAAGRQQAGNDRQQHRNRDKCERILHGQAHQIGNLLARKCPGIDRKAHEHHHDDGKDAGDKAFDKRLGVKHIGHVAL